MSTTSQALVSLSLCNFAVFCCSFVSTPVSTLLQVNSKQQAQESGRQRQLQLTDTLLQLPQLRCTGSRQARHTAGLVVQLAGWLLVELTHTVWLTGTLSFRGWGRVDLEHKAGGYRDGMAATKVW